MSGGRRIIGAGAVGALKDFKQGKKTDVLSVATTSWAIGDASTLQVVVSATAGDILEAELAGRCQNEANWVNMDAATIVGGSITNRFSNDANGVASWFALGNEYQPLAGPVQYTVQSGDVVNDQVTVALVTKGSTTSPAKTFGVPMIFGVKNLGQPGIATIQSTIITPDTQPSLSNPADYEFSSNSTSLPSGWSWVNQGSATYNETLGIGALDLPGGGADESRHIVQNIPAAGSFTLIVKFYHISPGSGLFQSRHIVLRDSATDKQMRFSLVIAASPELVVDYYSNNTTFSNRRGAAVVLQGDSISAGVPYVKIVKNSATSWDWYVSQDGVGWLPIHSAINVSTDLTPNQIGIGANMRTARTIVSAHHFRVT